MIIRVHMNLSLYGENFSPGNFSRLTGLRFDEVTEPGETRMTIGRYKGQLAPYGSASLRAETGSQEDYNDRLFTLLRTFHDNASEHLLQHGINKTTLWLTLAYDEHGQWGFEIRPDNLLLIGQLNATLAVDIYCDNGLAIPEIAPNS